jgi:Ca-activated chloride channel homolog
MSFLNPISLLLGLLSGAIVLMYLLKLRRRREEFSSTLLWRRSMEDLTANSPFQKLRQNLLMYLQILLLLLLVLALARPTMMLRRTRGIARVLLMDNSASMSATDGEKGRSRLEDAKNKAADLIGNMGDDQEMMVLSLGGAARVVQAFTAEKATLRAALGRIEPTDANSSIAEAMVMARGIVKTRPNCIITLLSDGGEGYVGNILTESDPVEFIPVGASDCNCGIVAFDLRESFERKGQLQAFAEVQNFSAEPANVLVRCLVDGRSVQAREEKIEPKSRKGFVFTGFEGSAGQLLRIEIESDGDLLACDNAVQGFIKLTGDTGVLVVSQGNFFLERALGLLPGVSASKIAPSQYQPSYGGDLVIFDWFAPKELGPGRYLFINAVPPLEGFSAATSETLKNQTLLDYNRLHPVTRFLDLGSLAFSETRKVRAPDWMVPLAESAGGPLVLAGERRGVKLLLLNFDLYASDWPLQVSFPIFLSNAVRWLGAETQGSLSGSHLAGETITLPAQKDLRVTNPAGQSWTCRPDENHTAYFSETYQTGVYTVREEEKKEEERFAINLLSVPESDITPRKEIVSGEKKVAATSVRKENREVWTWAVLAALLLLATEWHIYCRRAWL